MLHTHILYEIKLYPSTIPSQSLCIDVDRDPEQDESQLSLAVPESRSGKLVEYSVPAKA